MEGGVDMEERSSLEAAQESTKHVAETQDDAAAEEEENKFQKAIGAWRSAMVLRFRYRRELTMRQTSTSRHSFRSSIPSHQTLSHTKETL
jgi:hypothetical protein